VAFDQTTGDVAWKRHTFTIRHSSPILVKFQGEDQCVFCANESVMGVNPTNGDLLWEYKAPEGEFRGIFATPVWDGKDTLYFSTVDEGYGLKLTRGAGGTSVEQLWSSRKTPLGQSTPVLFGDMLVGPKRGNPTNSLLLAVDIHTGKRHWAKRKFPMSVAIGGGGKLIILDHNGLLGLVTATEDGLTIHAQYQLTEQWSFTAPTLVGTTLYVRDEKYIMALDLGTVGDGTTG
jgi:outer membrane protein assembly factor BamB